MFKSAASNDRFFSSKAKAWVRNVSMKFLQQKRTEIPKPETGSGSGNEPQQASEIESGSGGELAEGN